MKKLSQRLAQKRKAKKLRQHQIAERLDVSLGAVSQWEQGKTRPNMNHLLALAKMLDVSLDWLLSGTESTKEPQPTNYQGQGDEVLAKTTQGKRLSGDHLRLLEAFAKLPKDWQGKVIETIQLLAEHHSKDRG